MTNATLRKWQFSQLQNAVNVIGYLVHSVSEQDATTYRDGGQGWTVTEVMCHLRDYEMVYMERVRLTVEQDFPDLLSPNPDELAVQNNYQNDNLLEVYQAWVAHRQALLAYLQPLDDSAWERAANHPTRGRLDLNHQLALIAWHDLNHLEQMTHILEQKLK
ncbi:MAG: DinB family protein [Anaerolineae bacterium]|nr:DinB family protein [Anaerolineae bacterium]